MHQYYEVKKSAILLKNEDEVNPRYTELDFTLVEPMSSVVLEIGSLEAEVWKKLEKGMLIPEIIAEISMEFGKYEGDRIAIIIDNWEGMGLIKPPISKWKRCSKSWWKRAAWVEFAIHNPTGKLRELYRYFFWIFFSTWGAAFLFGINLLAGLILVDSYFHRWETMVAGTRNFSIIGIALLTIFSLSLHELGHAMAMIWARAKIVKAGIALNLGMPVFFVDTSTIWSRPKFHRIITAMGGVFVNATVASIAVLLTLIVKDRHIVSVLWQLIFINIMQLLFSLIPFVKMDGYYVMIDLLGLPNLGNQSASELKQVIHHPKKIVGMKDKGLYLAYGSLSMIASAGMIIYVSQYWLKILGIKI